MDSATDVGLNPGEAPTGEMAVPAVDESLPEIEAVPEVLDLSTGDDPGPSAALASAAASGPDAVSDETAIDGVGSSNDLIGDGEPLALTPPPPPPPVAPVAPVPAAPVAARPAPVLFDDPAGLDEVAEIPIVAPSPPRPPRRPASSTPASPTSAPSVPSSSVAAPVAPSSPPGPATERVPIPPADPDSTGEIMKRPVRPARPLQQPVAVRRPPRARVRRVTRVVRSVDTWSVFKIAAIFNLFMLVVMLTAGVLLWKVAVSTGTIDNIERGFENVGWEVIDLKSKGGEIFRNAWIAGLFAVIGLTGLAVLFATLFNLITDLVGGVRVTVLEEEVRSRDERPGMVVQPHPGQAAAPMVRTPPERS